MFVYLFAYGADFLARLRGSGHDPRAAAGPAALVWIGVVFRPGGFAYEAPGRRSNSSRMIP